MFSLAKKVEILKKGEMAKTTGSVLYDKWTNAEYYYVGLLHAMFEK